MKLKITLLIVAQLLFSCASKRNLVYFNELEEGGEEKDAKSKIIQKIKEPLISSGDIFSISVSSLNQAADVPFNKIKISGGSSDATTPDDGYLVDENGNIDFPILKEVKIGGLTKIEAKKLLTKKLEEYLSKPIVTLRYLNYRITVIGEVKKPSSFLVPSEKITLLEALGLAGDLTVYGNRQNVMIVKEVSGKREIVRLNLNKKETLFSPYYYLEPNDVVYVEPVDTKKAKASLTKSNISLILSIISTLTLAVIGFSR